MADDDSSASRIPCPHCGGTHGAGRRRCSKTGRALGGDPRLVGQLIDKRYRIVRLLGDGPFGAVYKAEHVTVGRHVSLRILPKALVEHPVVLNRFFREARLMSSLAGRRLHALLDAGLSSEGLAYVAYEYVRGRSLAAALAVEAPLPLELAATIVCDVLEGLVSIHESGFVHRAISPESVILQMSLSGVERAIVTNFGAGALEEPDGAQRLGDALRAAELPRVFVPPTYVPPERERGAPPHRREDIFGAGVTLAACLSPNGVLCLGSALVAQGVSPSIEAIVARATSPSEKTRFETAGEMRELLVPYCGLDEEDPSSVTETHISDLRMLSRRERSHPASSAKLRLSDSDEGGRASIEAALAGAILRALRSSAGPRWREIVRELPGVEHYVAPEQTARAPFSLVAAALEAGDELFGANDRLFCTTIGERSARDELGQLLQREHGPMTPELFFDQAATDWGRRLGHKLARATHVGRGYARLELREHPEPSLAVCACFTAMLTATLSRLGARHVEVNKTACEGVGDAACIYGATWM